MSLSVRSLLFVGAVLSAVGAQNVYTYSESSRASTTNNGLQYTIYPRYQSELAEYNAWLTETTNDLAELKSDLDQANETYQAAVADYVAAYNTYQTERESCEEVYNKTIEDECVPCIKDKCEDRAYDCLDDFSKFLFDSQVFFTQTFPNAFETGYDETAEFFTNDVANFGTGVGEDIADFGSDLGGDIVDFGSDIGDFGSDLGGDIVDFGSDIGDFGSDLGGDIGDFGSDIGDFGSDLGGDIVDFGSDIGDFGSDLGGDIVDFGSDIGDFGSDLGGDIVDFGSDIGDFGSDLGGDIVDFGSDIGDFGSDLGGSIGGILGRKRRRAAVARSAAHRAAVAMSRRRRAEADCDELEKDPNTACAVYQEDCPCDPDLSKLCPAFSDATDAVRDAQGVYNDTRDAYAEAYNTYVAAVAAAEAEQEQRLEDFCWGVDFNRHYNGGGTGSWWTITEMVITYFSTTNIVSLDVKMDVGSASYRQSGELSFEPGVNPGTADGNAVLSNATVDWFQAALVAGGHC